MGLKLGQDLANQLCGHGWQPGFLAGIVIVLQSKLSQEARQKAWKVRQGFAKLDKWGAKSHGWNTQAWNFEAYVGQPDIWKILAERIEL